MLAYLLQLITKAGIPVGRLDLIGINQKMGYYRLPLKAGMPLRHVVFLIEFDVFLLVQCSVAGK
jgi:hypothetical protein